MSKNRSAAGITNIVQYDANKNITFVSGSATLLTVSSSGALTTTGTITAQTLVVQTITSSVNFITGSTKFGVIVGNTHQFTGSVNVTGSLSVVTTGTEFQVTNTGVNLGNVLTDSHVISGSLRVNPNGLFVSGSGLVGIGTTSPLALLDVCVLSSGARRLLVNYADSIVTVKSANDTATAENLRVWGDNIFFYTGSAGSGGELMRLTNTGRVGIGTSSPWGKFNVVDGTNKSFVVQDAGIADTIELTNYSNGGGLRNIALTSATLIFNTGTAGGGTANERMRISSVGKVTIGSTSLAGDDLFNVTNSSATGYGASIQGGSSSSNYSFVVRKFDGTEYFQVRGDGYLKSPTTYNNTTATAANLSISTSGFIERSTSSIKYKKEIRDYNKGLAEVLQMRPVYYKGKSESDGEKQFAGLIAEEIHDLGLTEFVQYAEDGTPDALAYQNMIALLTKAIQELKAEIDALKAQ